MPEIEYIKNYTKPSGREIPKGRRGHATREKAKELEDAGYIVIVGSESTKATQHRTSVINEGSDTSKNKKSKDSKSSKKSKED